MEKQILVEFMQVNCVGYQNRLTGREIEAQIGINYKRISDIVLDNLELNIINYNGYFVPTKEDNKILNNKMKNLKTDYYELNARVGQLERIMFDLNCGSLIDDLSRDVAKTFYDGGNDEL